ncbi:hypothetical protein L7F22_016262 [Adiantum nelumboides]|nr:hypothetical protein [Adiantum nelumboides]
MELEVLFKGTAEQSRLLTSEPAIHPSSCAATSLKAQSGRDLAAAPSPSLKAPSRSLNGDASAGVDHAAMVEAEAEKLMKQYCSHPLRRHPLQAALEAECQAWLADLYSPYLPAILVQRLLDTRLDTLGCVFYPQSPDYRRALALVKLMHWFFILDDVVDDAHLLGHDYDGARRFALRQYRAIFGDNIKEAQQMGLIDEGGYGFEDEGSGLAALRKNKMELAVTTTGDGAKGGADAAAAREAKRQARVLEELAIEIGVQWATELQATGLSPRHVERLREGVAHYMVGVISLARLRQEKRLPSVDEYIRLRRMDGAAMLGLLACELDAHIELDDETLHHPLIQRLQWATVNQMLWINDLLSFYRESNIDDYVSLLGVLHYNNVAASATTITSEGGGQKPPQEMAGFEYALSQARAMIKDCDDECVRLTRDIGAWRPHLDRYVDATLSFVSGLAFWTLWSSRYHIREVLI